jgi:hypothetical protein
MKARTRHASALLSAVALLATGPPAHARTHATKTCVKPVGAATVHRDRYTVRYRKIIGSAPDLRVFYWRAYAPPASARARARHRVPCRRARRLAAHRALRTVSLPTPG